MTPNLATFRLRPRLRAILRSMLAGACPPDAAGLADDVLDHVELSLRAMPAEIRAGLVAGLLTYDLAALPRFRRPARKLAERDACEHYRRWKHGLGLQRELCRGAGGLLKLAYYELPAVQVRLGYRPQRWIAKVTERRLARYGADIAAHEAALLEPEPLLDEIAAHRARTAPAAQTGSA